MFETILGPDNVEYEVSYSLLGGVMPTVAAPRSGHWPAVRRAHLVKEPCCQVCGSTEELNVHHIKPFHEHPDLELEDSNLITLCQSGGAGCHLLFGHLKSWKSHNPHVRVDAKTWHDKIKHRPESHPAHQGLQPDQAPAADAAVTDPVPPPSA